MHRPHVAIAVDGSSSLEAPAPQPSPNGRAQDVGAAGASGSVSASGILPSACVGKQEKDNAAIAIRDIAVEEELFIPGERPGMLEYVGRSHHHILEGHRFAATAIAQHAAITSWGITFGVALRDIQPGEYLCNIKAIASLKDRRPDLRIPAEANFVNASFARYTLPAEFKPAPAPAVVPSLRFQGFVRTRDRGVGIRNYVIVLGVSSQAGPFVRRVEALFRTKLAAAGAISLDFDGVVAVAHTEGGLDASDPAAAASMNNWPKILRALCGFVMHPNVAGVLLVDCGVEQLRAEHLTSFLREHKYNTNLPIRSLTLAGDQTDTPRAVELVDALVESARREHRTSVPLSALALAQQCGGSDAFSGISANPLAGAVAEKLVREGACTLLCETDELIGAESYILEHVRDRATADKFLEMVGRFYRYTGRFGHSPEGNPSGGNLYRGLYNITLKSAGAALKKAKPLRLEHVVEYGEQLAGRAGYCFMDSPGNDLESIAGQVGSGCQMIMFTTGNGSITNFPFVPTIKVLTTTRRFNLMSHDIDVNAGEYIDGTSTMATLAERTLTYVVNVASGMRTCGERAGHSQVQLWRNWRHVAGDESDVAERHVPADASTAGLVASEVETLGQTTRVDEDGPRHGKPLQVPEALADARFDGGEPEVFPPGLGGSSLHARDRVALVLPTSLCSSMVADMYAQRLTAALGPDSPFSRVLALPHTEGCGHSSGPSESMFVRTMLGYALHPSVAVAVLLEHGCEKTHNDYMTKELRQMGVDPHRFQYASVQLDGGIEACYAKVTTIFATLQARTPAVPRALSSPSNLRIGLLSNTAVPSGAAAVLARLAAGLVNIGGTVVCAGTARVSCLTGLFSPSLGYGQLAEPGLHAMHCSTSHFTELLTGLAATGVHVVIAFVGIRPQQTHMLVPVLQATARQVYGSDFVLDEATIASSATIAATAKNLAELVVAVASGQAPALWGERDALQITRGLAGITM